MFQVIRTWPSEVLTLSVKQARKQEVASTTSRIIVMGLVAASQVPLLVNMGVSSWKAKRVPVGSRLARLAVPVNVCESALCDIDGGLWRTFPFPPPLPLLGVSGSASWGLSPMLEEEVSLAAGSGAAADDAAPAVLIRRDIFSGA